MDENALKTRLQELIENSDTINSLLPAAKAAYLEKTLNASPEKMQQIIKIFEEELVEDKNIAEEFAYSEEEIAEMKANKSKQARVKRQKREKTEREKENLLAENLLKKLDQIL